MDVDEAQWADAWQRLESLLREVLVVPADPSVTHVWRGQADVAWPPLPTLYRRLLRRYPRAKVTEELLRRYEIDLFCEAIGRGFYKGDRLATLVALQHHGGATRFLDVTRNPLAALWFASDPVSATVDGVLYHYGVRGERVFLAHEVMSLETLIDNDSVGQLMAYFPRPDGKRIRAQQAGFLLTALAGSLADSSPFDSDSDGCAVRRFVVPADLKILLRQYLSDSAGISTVGIYPDFAGFALANASDAPFARDEHGLYTGENGLFPNRR